MADLAGPDLPRASAGVAETTVITHLNNAKRKLGARTRSQAVALALMAGLI